MDLFGEKRNITDNLRYLPGNTSTNGSLGSGEPAESWSGRVNSAVQGSTEVFIDGAPSSEWGTRRGAVRGKRRYKPCAALARPGQV